MNIIERKFHGAIRKLRRIKIRIAFKLGLRNDNLEINSPIFLTGLSGGGLTLLSAMLHRNCHCVYVTGNCKYWAGQDETHHILRNELPENLTWKNIPRIKFRHRVHETKLHGDIHATDEILPYYISTKIDFNRNSKSEIEKVIRTILTFNQHKLSKNPLRYIDKSQLYTIKVGMLNELLKEYNPKFVLITRNPYAWCWRKINHYPLDYRLPELSKKEWLELACEHWKNSFSVPLNTKEADVKSWRFEDLLLKPEKTLRGICDFVGLEFNKNMLPQPDQKIPIGSENQMFVRKWYPLRPDVNNRYLENIPEWAITMIREECGEIADKFDYTPEGP